MIKEAKLRQELRDLIIRNFAMKHNLANTEITDLLCSIPELFPIIEKEIDVTIRRSELHHKKSSIASFLKWLKEGKNESFLRVLQPYIERYFDRLYEGKIHHGG